MIRVIRIADEVIVRIDPRWTEFRIRIELLEVVISMVAWTKEAVRIIQKIVPIAYKQTESIPLPRGGRV